MNKKGICPYCGSDIIEYGLLYWNNEDDITQECNCGSCGKSFDEIYNTKYDHTDTYDEEEEESSDKCETCKHWHEKEHGVWMCGKAFSLSNPQSCVNNNLYEPKNKQEEEE